MTVHPDDLPYLSVVATGRNDDHGGNPLYRTQIFVSGLIAQCERYKVPAELILVEWNPPDDRPRLADVLRWPAEEGYCTVRIIEVPHELHSRLEYSDRLPLYQMIGKNVGIRRARGEFVLATNIDILLSDELMRVLARRQLRPGYVYRVDRYDVPAEIDLEWPIEQQLRSCEESVIRINRREGTLDLRDGTFYRINAHFSFIAWLRNSPTGRRLLRSPLGGLLGLRLIAYARPLPHRGPLQQVGDSAIASRVWNGRPRLELWSAIWLLWYLGFRVYAFAYWFVAGFNDPRQVPARIRRRLGNLSSEALAGDDGARGEARRRRTAALVVLPLTIYRGLLRVLAQKRRSLYVEREYERARLPLHTNASGDFTLMSREDWDRTQGYAELEMYSMHIDGLHLYTAHYAGIKARFLPCKIFHIEHGGGFRPEATGDTSLDRTLARRAIPQITNRQLMDYIVEMSSTGAPIAFNRSDWGFAGADLRETNPLPGRMIVPAEAAHA